jgi:hypothetical protein
LGRVAVPRVSDVIPTNETNEAKEAREKIIDLNDQGYSDLITMIDTTKSGGKVAFSIVKCSKTNEYPNGNIGVTMDGLKRKYAPKTAPSLSKVHKVFYGAKLKKKTDPDIFITYLEDVRNRMIKMNSSMTDNQFILHVMNNLTKDYEMQILKMEDKIGDGENALTIEDLRDELNLHFRRLNAKDDSDNEDNKEEKALFGRGQFKGRCSNCGKYGHKSADCHSSGKGLKKTAGTEIIGAAQTTTKATMPSSKAIAGTATSLAIEAPTAERQRK